MESGVRLRNAPGVVWLSPCKSCGRSLRPRHEKPQPLGLVTQGAVASCALTIMRPDFAGGKRSYT